MLTYVFQNNRIVRDEADIGDINVMEEEDFLRLQSFPREVAERFAAEFSRIPTCKADIRGEQLMGSLSIPKKEDFFAPKEKFYYYFDKKVLIIVDSEGFAEKVIEEMSGIKRNYRSTAEFLVSLFDRLIIDDHEFLNELENEIAGIEDSLLESYQSKNINSSLLTVRKKIIGLQSYYDQLSAMAERIEEEEYFSDESTTQLRLFLDRVERLSGKVSSLREYCSQIREALQSQTDLAMNRVMQTLTVITAVFMPLTLVSTWYGMNFDNMPELHMPYAYPITAVLTLVLTGLVIWICKKKKLL